MVKKETLSVKLSLEEKEVIKQATEIKSVSFSSFARMTVLEKAREILLEKLREKNGTSNC